MFSILYNNNYIVLNRTCNLNLQALGSVILGKKSNKTAVWVLKNFLIYGLAFVIFYCIGWGLGIIPQPLKDAIQWFADNFGIIAFLLCFTLGAIIIFKILSHLKVKQNING